MSIKPVTTQIADSKFPASTKAQLLELATTDHPVTVDFDAAADPESCDGIGCAGADLPALCEPCRRTQREMLTGPGDRR